MKKLLSLLKISLLGFANFNMMRHTKDKKRRSRTIWMFVTFVFVAVMMLGIVFTSFYGIGYTLNQLGALDALLAIACAGASIAVFVTTTAKVAPTLFTFRDYELLMSLPVKENTLVLSRILRLYGANLFFMSFLLLPAGAVYLVFSPQGVWFYVRFFVLLFFVPFLPLSLAAVVGTLISSIGARFRRSNVVSLILLFVFVIALMAFSFLSPVVVENIESISKQLSAGVGRMFPPAAWYALALADGDALNFLLFVLAGAAVFAAFIWVVGRNFKKLNTLLRTKTAMRMQKQKESRANSLASALYKKEIKFYFASTLYVFNTAFGAVLMVIASVALAVMGGEKLGALLEIPGLPGIMKAAAPFALALFVCMSATTPSSISMEGGRFWQLKALPLRADDIFCAKIRVSLTIMVPALIVASTVLTVVLKADLANAFLMYAVPLLYAVFVARVGLYVNLCMPKFEWRSEEEVVKQGAPVIITMLIGMAASILPVIWLAGAAERATLYGFVVLAAMALLTAAAGVLLKKDGAKRFARL